MGMHRRTIRFKLNGRLATADIATHETLVEVLRRDFGLFGGRESCGQGLCGCCTALVDGLAVSGCLYLAAFVDGTEVVTVEGLGKNNEIHPIQRSFMENCAFQCGFCTPGFILMTKELLERNAHPTTDDIRHYLSGNLPLSMSSPSKVESLTRDPTPILTCEYLRRCCA